MPFLLMVLSAAAEILRVINDYDLIGEEKMISETGVKEIVKSDDITANIGAQ